jgi:hypothetical protein
MAVTYSSYSGTHDIWGILNEELSNSLSMRSERYHVGRHSASETVRNKSQTCGCRYGVRRIQAATAQKMSLVSLDRSVDINLSKI